MSELIKRLRDSHRLDIVDFDLYLDAADLIEQQAAQLLDARRTAEYWKAEHNAANARIAELEAVCREAIDWYPTDAAPPYMSYIREVMNHSNPSTGGAALAKQQAEG